ncbi:MAG: hypothetical protein ACKV2U_11025 [Bryobacteraceae bacterium]
MQPYPITDYIVGFDLGRDRDHSAIAGMDTEYLEVIEKFRQVVIRLQNAALSAGHPGRLPRLTPTSGLLKPWQTSRPNRVRFQLMPVRKRGVTPLPNWARFLKKRTIPCVDSI